MTGTHCGCGCNGLAPLAQRNNARLGHIKGRALPFISGHNSRGRTDLARYILEDAGYSTACWKWVGLISRKGYGVCQVNRTKKNAHRAVYEATHGELLRVVHLDHVCRNKLCVNPDHMEPVSAKENERRKRLALAQASAAGLLDRMINATA